MNIAFDYKVAYFFDILRIDETMKIQFVTSLGLVFIFGLVSQLLLRYKPDRIKRSTNLVYDIMLEAVIIFSNIVVMLLMMTCNGWVILALLFGLMFGYMAFHSKYTRRKAQLKMNKFQCC